MFRPVKISARLSGATALLVVHADSDAAVVGHRDGVAGVSEATLGLGTVASSALVFSTDLKEKKSCGNEMDSCQSPVYPSTTLSCFFKFVIPCTLFVFRIISIQNLEFVRSKVRISLCYNVAK